MRCPLCSDPRSFVIETYRKGERIRRRRECSQCRFRWSTEEIMINVPVSVRSRTARSVG
jgi:transcriptional regulator NrdR family protein